MLWRAGQRDDVPCRQRPSRLYSLVGSFNLVEGLINHQILGIHHVKPGRTRAWDLGFLAIGAVLTVAGWILLRAEQQDSTSARTPVLVAVATINSTAGL